MINDPERYDRNIGLFTREGQARIQAARVGFAGLGGLGSHLVQQLAFLGTQRFVLVDGDRVSHHSLNRLITAGPGDENEYKTDLAERLIRRIQPDADVVSVRQYLPHPDAKAALAQINLLLGGLDHDAPRLYLTDLASVLGIVYIDAATDTDSHRSGTVRAYGGRVVTAGASPGCLYCLDLLDQTEIRHAGQNQAERAAEADIYGVPLNALDGTGPSVVTINGVVASLAATEAMVCLTGLRPPVKQLIYRAEHGSVRLNIDEPHKPMCPYCVRWFAEPSR